MPEDHTKKLNIAAVYGLSITVLVTGLFIYWFRYADRNIVFLYYHDMGPYIPSTAPFITVTSSRYWMAGMVASGLVMFLYWVINTALHLTRQSYKLPVWQSVWKYPAVLLCILIPIITMTTTHAPALPFGLAAKVTVVTLIGLILALQVGTLAGRKPSEVAFLAVDGLALSFILIAMTGIERVQGWIDRGADGYVVLMVLMILSGGISLMVMTGVRYGLKRPATSSLRLYLAGLCVAYPGMSILHHLAFTDGYYYITDSDNFLARNIVLQVSIWLISWLVCKGISRLRNSLVIRNKTVL